MACSLSVECAQRADREERERNEVDLDTNGPQDPAQGRADRASERPKGLTDSVQRA